MRRLRDDDVDVRLGVLSRLIELGADSIENLTAITLKEMGGRLSDKKIEVRKLALVGLSRLYSRYISSNLPSIGTFLDSQEEHSLSSQEHSSNSQSYGQRANNNNNYNKNNKNNHNNNENENDNNVISYDHLSLFSNLLKNGVLEKLGFVPGFVVNSWGYVEMRQLVIQLLQENILPK